MRKKRLGMGRMHTQPPVCSTECVNMVVMPCFTATSLGSSLSTSVILHSEDSEAISSLITLEIDYDGTPAFLSLFPRLWRQQQSA